MEVKTIKHEELYFENKTEIENLKLQHELDLIKEKTKPEPVMIISPEEK